jgi:hypothetical protein
LSHQFQTLRLKIDEFCTVTHIAQLELFFKLSLIDLLIPVIGKCLGAAIDEKYDQRMMLISAYVHFLLQW